MACVTGGMIDTEFRGPEFAPAIHDAFVIGEYFSKVLLQHGRANGLIKNGRVIFNKIRFAVIFGGHAIMISAQGVMHHIRQGRPVIVADSLDQPLMEFAVLGMLAKQVVKSLIDPIRHAGRRAGDQQDGEYIFMHKQDVLCATKRRCYSAGSHKRNGRVFTILYNTG